jgi:hypothetical protein
MTAAISCLGGIRHPIVYAPMRQPIVATHRPSGRRGGGRSWPPPSAPRPAHLLPTYQVV